MEDRGRGHTFVDHTSEVEVMLRAPDLAGLFEEAGQALAEVMGAAPGAGGEASESIAVRGRDREALLVAFLNELVYRSEMSGRVFTRIQVERATDTELTATVTGPLVATVAVPVKAASFHGLAVENGENCLEASLILDV